MFFSCCVCVCDNIHFYPEAYCHIVILSYCHIVILSYCHIVILSYCHIVILSYCHIVILSYLSNYRAMSTGTSTDPKPLGFFQRIFRRKPSCVVDDTLTAHTGQKRVTISPRRYSTPVVQSVAVVHPMEKLLVLKGNMDGWTTGKGKPSNAKFSDKDRRSMQRRSSRRRKNRPRLTKDLSFVDVSQPLEYPCTPETLLSYHKRKEMLGPTEEWLVVELNEYECLIESLEIIQASTVILA